MITSVILQEGISEKSAPTKESAVAMVTKQTARGDKAEPLLWALYTIFNNKSLVLALQSTTMTTSHPHSPLDYLCVCICLCVYIHIGFLYIHTHTDP